MTVTVGDVITQVAEHFGLDPVLCLADGWHESGLNPRAQGDDFGQGPSSFGLYQLHRGGELGDLTPEQAFNPTTNAMVALGTMAGFKAQTGLSGGALAAAAERPANPGAYAAVIDSLIAQINAGNFPAGFIAARDADAGVPAPFPPKPTPTPQPVPMEADMLILVQNPNNKGWAVLNLTDGTFRGFSNADLLSFWEANGLKKATRQPTVDEWSHFVQGGTI